MVRNILNEDYIGSKEEREIIKKELATIRNSLPQHFSQEKLLANLISNIEINNNLFKKAVELGEKYMLHYSDRFKFLPLSRYIIYEPIGIGGFYGKPEGGFSHSIYAGFTTLLNKQLVPNKEVRTFELFRNYFHDSIHACTFRSYKLNPETQKPYRYQYGINYRDINGLSYSAPNITLEAPLKINLNVLMDGIIQLFISKFIKDGLENWIIYKDLNNLETEIVDEFLNGNATGDLFNEPKEFYKDVLNPTKLFLNFWGGEILFDEIMHAIFSGKLAELRAIFNEKMFVTNAWEIIFKQKQFLEL